MSVSRDLPDSRCSTFQHLVVIFVALALCSTAWTAGSGLKLNAPLGPGEDLNIFPKITADGATVVYGTRDSAQSTSSLFSVPSNGGSATRLYGPSSDGWNVESYQIPNDGSKVVFTLNHDGSAPYKSELFSVAITGGAPVRLDSSLDANGGIDEVRITPDSATVVYSATQDQESAFDLYSVPIGGGTAVRLSEGVPYGNRIRSIDISPDSATVVYRVDQEVDYRYELYVTPTVGGPSTKLHRDLIDGEQVIRGFITPDGSRVVYTIKFPSQERTYYSVPITGGTSADIFDVADYDMVGSVRISPDGATMVYAYDNVLHSVPILGGPTVTLTPPGFSGDVGSVEITLDSTQVIYASGTDGSYDDWAVFAVPIDGGASVQLSPDGFGDFDLSPDHVYIVCQGPFASSDLYSVLIAGGVPVKLNGDARARGSMRLFSITGDSSTVAYPVRNEYAGVELYSVPIGGGTPVRASAAMPDGRNAIWRMTAPVGDAVFYMADQDEDDVYEFFRAFEDATAPLFTDLQVVPSRAGPGTTVRISFTASETLLETPQVTVNGNAAVLVGGSKSVEAYSFEYDVTEDDNDGLATIEISGEDLGNNAGSLQDGIALEILDEPLSMPLSVLPIALVLSLAFARTVCRKRHASQLRQDAGKVTQKQNNS